MFDRTLLKNGCITFIAFLKSSNVCDHVHKVSKFFSKTPKDYVHGHKLLKVFHQFEIIVVVSWNLVKRRVLSFLGHEKIIYYVFCCKLFVNMVTNFQKLPKFVTMFTNFWTFSKWKSLWPWSQTLKVLKNEGLTPKMWFPPFWDATRSFWVQSYWIHIAIYPNFGKKVSKKRPFFKSLFWPP